MTTTTNDAAETLPRKDFLIKDYELKVRYLTDHFGRMWTNGETVIQLHGTGPWQINYVNPADDPRNKE